MGPGAVSRQGRIYNILVLEDRQSWQKQFARFLSEEPFKVSIAANNREALSCADIDTPDLLIVDVNLSGVPYNVDGLAVAHQLWSQNRDLRIIIVSGDRGWDKRLDAYQFVPSYILEKQSLDQDDFVAKVYRALTQK